MVYLACLLGIIIGAAVGFSWCQAKNAAQLRAIVDLLDDRQFENSSLPVGARLRRSAVKIHRQLQELEEQLQNWQDIWQSAPIGYLQLNADNQILRCNVQAQILLHITDWEASRLRLFLEVVRSYDIDRLVDRTRQTQEGQELEWEFYPSYDNRRLKALTNKAAGKLEWQFYNSDDGRSGDSRATMLRASTVFLPDRSVGIFLENLQPLVALSQARERWTIDLAHELRTPLTSMRLVAETIQSKLEPPLDKWSGRMLQEIDRLAKLVQDFLDLSQLEETPSKAVRRSLVNLADLIDNAWQGLEPLASQNAVTLVPQGEMGIQLQADPGRLMQVFINVFDNALKYSPKGGQILVNIELHGSQVVIEILDEGAGFAPADLPHVFDRLFRGDASRQYTSGTASITTGNGLGLAIVQQIVLAHGGIVTAQNHPATGGGLVKINLPIH